MKKILITGCSGYIGSNLCHYLKYQYNNLVLHGLDVKDPIVELKEFYKADLTKNINIKEKYDCVIHLAAFVKVSESMDKPWDYYQNNIFGTQNLIQNVQFDNIIFSSTSNAYNPNNPYAASKLSAEFLIQQTNNYSIFRIFNVVGSRVAKSLNDDGIIAKLEKASETGIFTIYGNDYPTHDGTCIRHYIHVLEVCHAILKSIENPTNKIQDLAHKKPLTVLEAVNIYKKINNKNFETNFGSKRKGDLSESKACNISEYMVEIFNENQLFMNNN